MSKTMVAAACAALLGGCAMQMASEEEIEMLDEELASERAPGDLDDPPPGWDPDNLAMRGTDPCPECRFILIPQAGTTDRVSSYRMFTRLLNSMQSLGVRQLMLRDCDLGQTSCTLVNMPVLNTSTVPSTRPQFVYPTTSLYGRVMSSRRLSIRYYCYSASYCAGSNTQTDANGPYFEYLLPNTSTVSTDRVITELSTSRWVSPYSNTYDPRAIIWFPPLTAYAI